MIGTSERELYVEILEAAVEMIGCGGGSVQVAATDGPGAGPGLRLVASRGLDPASAEFWGFVESGPSSVCGLALAAGRRVVIEDVEAEPELAQSEGLREFRRSGLRAIQSTPLTTCDGLVAGMLSTYWPVPHEPSGEELRLVDLLAGFMDVERLPLRCAWCRRIEIDGSFVDIPTVPEREPDLLRERATHGICADCLDRELRKTAIRRAAEARRLARELREQAAAARVQAHHRQQRARNNQDPDA